MSEEFDLHSLAPSLANFCALRGAFKITSNDNQQEQNTIRNDGYYGNLNAYQPTHTQTRQTTRERTFQFYCGHYPHLKWNISYVIIKDKKLAQINFSWHGNSQEQVSQHLKLTFYNDKEVINHTQKFQLFKRGMKYPIYSYNLPTDYKEIRVVVTFAYFIQNEILLKKIEDLHSESISGYQSCIQSISDTTNMDWGKTVILRSKNRKYEAVVHQHLLDKYSPVLSSMFQENFKEGIERSAVIPVENNILKSFITFIYSGQLPSNSKDFSSMLYFADKYQIDVLKEYCELQLIKSVNYGNSFSLMSVAYDCRATQLNEVLAHFMVQFSLVGTPEWEEFADKNPKAVIDSFKIITASGIV